MKRTQIKIVGVLMLFWSVALPAAAESFSQQKQNAYIPNISTQAGQAGAASSQIQAGSSGMSQSNRAGSNAYNHRGQGVAPSPYFGRFDRRPLDVQSYREGYRDGSRSQRSDEAINAAIRACVVSSGHSYTACEARVLNSY